MLQPIMPLIEYETNKEYIASVLCENRNKPEVACNGKCYLNKKIEESQKHEGHDHSLPQIDFSKYPISLLEFYNSSIRISDSYRKSEFDEFITHPKKYSKGCFRPPIV